MKQANIELLEWPFQSPDLLENMATTLKSHVCAWKSRDLNEFYQFWQELVEGHLTNYKGRYVQIFQPVCII